MNKIILINIIRTAEFIVKGKYYDELRSRQEFIVHLNLQRFKVDLNPTQNSLSGSLYIPNGIYSGS